MLCLAKGPYFQQGHNNIHYITTFSIYDILLEVQEIYRGRGLAIIVREQLRQRPEIGSVSKKYKCIECPKSCQHLENHRVKNT